MLWAITSFFNPVGYQSRLTNFRHFRARLRVPLVAVELSFSGNFELGETDAEVMIRIPGGDVMWQKERLLNIALRSLPAECDIVAWIDCDVIFSSDDWPTRAREALKTSATAQLFSERVNLRPGAIDDSGGPFSVEYTAPGSAHKYVTGSLQPGDLNRPGSLIERRCTNGLAWAWPKDLLQQHGLYDARILGSGDKAMMCAAIGKFEYAEQAGSMNSPQREHYRRWASGLYADTRGRVGCIEGRIFHLWHGDARDRQYKDRHQALRQFEYDPFVDIALDSNQVWRWNSDKPEMHQFVAGTAGAPFYKQGEYAGNNTGWKLQRVKHIDKTYGYMLVEVDGNTATVTFKGRIAPGKYEAMDSFTYTAK